VIVVVVCGAVYFMGRKKKETPKGPVAPPPTTPTI